MQFRRFVFASFSPESRPFDFGRLERRRFCSTLQVYISDGLLIKSLFPSDFPRMKTRRRIDTAPNEPPAVFAIFAHLGQAFASPAYVTPRPTFR
jgi:hypothetical protein